MPWWTRVPGIVLVVGLWGCLLGGHGLIIAGLSIGLLETVDYKLSQARKRGLQDGSHNSIR